MPRPSKGPRLHLQKGGDRQPLWIIRDGQRKIGTGCPQGDRIAAERKLAAYINEKHDPKKDRGSDLAQVRVADPLSVYMTEKIAVPYPAHVVTDQQRRRHDHRKRAGIAQIERLNEYFGLHIIPQLNGKLCKAYAQQRGSQSSARRELEVLQAAVNYFVKDEVGGVQTSSVPGCLIRHSRANVG
jgi:hypothetical protein